MLNIKIYWNTRIYLTAPLLPACHNRKFSIKQAEEISPGYKVEVKKAVLFHAIPLKVLYNRPE